MVKMAKPGVPARTERPILNKLNVILAEGTEEGSKVIVYSSDAAARKTAYLLKEFGAHSAPGSGIGNLAPAGAAQPIVYA